MYFCTKNLYSKYPIFSTPNPISCVKNVTAFVVCGFLMKYFFLNMKKIWKKNLGNRLGVTCWIAQPIQSNLSGNGLDLLCYLADNTQTAHTFFFIFSAYIFLIINYEPTNHKCPHNFDTWYFSYSWCVKIQYNIMF